MTQGAFAGVSPATVEVLMRPVARAAFAASPEATELASRVLGRPFTAAATSNEWRAQAEELARRIETGSGDAAAEEMYLRLIRLEGRARARLGGEPRVGENGALEAASAEQAEALRSIVAEELAIKRAGILHRIGVRSGLAPVEFASVRAVRNAGEQFLAGGSGSGTAGERAITQLRQMVQGREAPYLLVMTKEGQAILRAIRGPGTRLSSDPAVELVDYLAARPEHRSDAIQLAYRLNTLLERYSVLKTKLNLRPRTELRKAVLQKLARDGLTLRPTMPEGADGRSALEFLPMASVSGAAR